MRGLWSTERTNRNRYSGQTARQVLEMKQPIKFCSFGGYRMFSVPWWKDLGQWITRGWLRDIKTYWHRARYGWAPRDTWSLDHYVSGVLGGALAHLAKHKNGTPSGYPCLDPQCHTDHDRWVADLQRWAEAFAAYARDDYYELHGTDYKAWHADEKRRQENMEQALKEMTPWFTALWD